MRNDLIVLTGVKVRQRHVCDVVDGVAISEQNEMTMDVHVHLRRVALFQARITEIIGPLSSLDADLRSKAVFPHLQRLHQLPFAYAASVVEIVRRKEFSAFLLDWTSRLSDTLGRYTSAEQVRRHQLKADTLSQLPLSVPALEESMSPKVEVSVLGESQSLAGVGIGREDIDSEFVEMDAGLIYPIDLMKWVDSLQADPEILAAIEGGDANPIDSLQTSLQVLIANMDVASGELDNMIERSGTCLRNCRN